MNQVLELVETLRRKSPCMRKYCSSASSHSSSDMLCGSSGFRAPCQLSLQLLRQSGKMPRPAPMDSDVEDGSPTTASKEFEAVCFKRSWWGVLVSGFYLLPAAAAISVATFWCLFLFGKCGYQQTFQGLKHALSWNIEPPTSSQNCNSDWIKTRIIMQHHKRLLVTSSHCGACSIDSIAWAQRDPCHQVAHC